MKAARLNKRVGRLNVPSFQGVGRSKTRQGWQAFVVASLTLIAVSKQCYACEDMFPQSGLIVDVHILHHTKGKKTIDRIAAGMTIVQVSNGSGGEHVAHVDREGGTVVISFRAYCGSVPVLVKLRGDKSELERLAELSGTGTFYLTYPASTKPIPAVKTPKASLVIDGKSYHVGQDGTLKAD